MGGGCDGVRGKWRRVDYNGEEGCQDNCYYPGMSETVGGNNYCSYCDGCVASCYIRSDNFSTTYRSYCGGICYYGYHKDERKRCVKN
jgi:hypothetical protein